MTKLDKETFENLSLLDYERESFETEEDAEEYQDWLEATFEMGFRVCEYEGQFYCISTESLPWHIRNMES